MVAGTATTPPPLATTTSQNFESVGANHLDQIVNHWLNFMCFCWMCSHLVAHAKAYEFIINSKNKVLHDFLDLRCLISALMQKKIVTREKASAIPMMTLSMWTSCVIVNILLFYRVSSSRDSNSLISCSMRSHPSKSWNFSHMMSSFCRLAMVDSMDILDMAWW